MLRHIGSGLYFPRRENDLLDQQTDHVRDTITSQGLGKESCTSATDTCSITTFPSPHCSMTRGSSRQPTTLGEPYNRRLVSRTLHGQHLMKVHARSSFANVSSSRSGRRLSLHVSRNPIDRITTYIHTIQVWRGGWWLCSGNTLPRVWQLPQ